jgi:hypothetical protein
MATLFRPVGLKELLLIKNSGWTKFPPRLPEQPIFYPVLNEEYATQITKDWNVKSTGFGFVTKFNIDDEYFNTFEIHNVGAKIHNELWVPARQLNEFNKHIIGKIEITKSFKK